MSSPPRLIDWPSRGPALLCWPKQPFLIDHLHSLRNSRLSNLLVSQPTCLTSWFTTYFGAYSVCAGFQVVGPVQNIFSGSVYTTNQTQSSKLSCMRRDFQPPTTEWSHCGKSRNNFSFVLVSIIDMRPAALALRGANMQWEALSCFIGVSKSVGTILR